MMVVSDGSELGETGIGGLGSRMNAIAHDRYGSPETLALRTLPVPVPQQKEVLIRIHAAAVHIGDCFCVRGAPFPVRFATGLLKPKCGIPGFDLAGTVQSVGDEVDAFKPGDKVFGAFPGACAEFACVPQRLVVSMPNNISFEQAAAVPTSGLAALHALRDVAKLQPSQKVLINGASGGIGTLAIQIAKSLGGHVTAVCSARNTELVRELGADVVIDYGKDDFTHAGPVFDLLFDNVENRSLADCRKVLKPGGMLICNSGTGATGLKFFRRLVAPLVLNPFVRHELRRYISEPNAADLGYLSTLLAEGKLRPVIGKTFPLSDTVDALRFVETGRSVGKVVIQVTT